MSLRQLFYPESIAVVGASPNLGGGKLPYYQSLQIMGYQGRLYPVNPAHAEIDGVKVYPGLDALPEAVDLAIVSVPARLALETIRSAIRRGIRFVHFYTSGFSEAGDQELEDAMLAAARKAGVRIVGPNCIGVHCTESRVTFDPTFQQADLGNVAFIGQSGGVTSNFVRLCQTRHIKLNKAVSIGNQIDVRVEDYLDYFAQDENIRVIAAYIEDIKDGRAFLEALRRTAYTKPVIVLKGGITPKGALAAASHTGAMAGQHAVFSSVMRQFGCIEAITFEQLIDLTMLASSQRRSGGGRVGFLGAGGGTSVLFADYAIERGLDLPELQRKTQMRIMERISAVNTSTVNPVDLGAYGFDFEIMAHTMQVMDADENLDVIIPYFSLDFISSFQMNQIESGPHLIVDTVRQMNKPVIPIFARFTEHVLHNEEVRIKIFEIFREAGLPVYSTIQDAVGAITGIRRWCAGTQEADKGLENRRVHAQ